MSEFIVTPASMRPASTLERCFYCHRPIGGTHKDDCVLINKKVVVMYSFAAKVDVPASWDEHAIDFWMNGSSHCKNNELRAAAKYCDEHGCSCFKMIASVVDPRGEAELCENGSDYFEVLDETQCPRAHKEGRE